MANTLLLYDTRDTDLVRDFEDFLKELGIENIIRIPAAANKGLHLEGKEKNYLDSADAVVFFITAGSQRLGSAEINPSASVSHEMGKIKTKFNDKKIRSVIYLVEEGCNPPVIDQAARIPFNRTDMRSVLQALALLIKDLKEFGICRTTPIPAQLPSAQKMSLEEFMQLLPYPIRDVLFDISNKPDGTINNVDFDKLLASKYNMTIQDINLFKRDLQSRQLMVNTVTSDPMYCNFWYLNNLGWDVVRVDAPNKKKEAAASLTGLLGAVGLATGPNPFKSTQKL